MDGDPVVSDAAPAVGVQQVKTGAHQTDSLVDEAVRIANTLNDKLPALSQESRGSGNHNAARRQEEEGQQPQQPSPPKVGAEAFGAHALQPSEGEASAGEADAGVTIAAPQGEKRETREAGGRVQERAASVGASAGRNFRPRVEKLREASTIVFDEASDDPGLRFVIVAVVLFMLFLLILLFSYILG